MPNVGIGKSFESVEDLTTPLTFHEYVERYWQHGFHHMPATEARLAQAKTLFEMDEFLRILFEAPVRGPIWNIAMDGRYIDTSIRNYIQAKLNWTNPPTLVELEALCENGASLVFNRIDKFHPRLVDFCRRSMQIMGENVNMNAYFSPKTENEG